MVLPLIGFSPSSLATVLLVHFSSFYSILHSGLIIEYLNATASSCRAIHVSPSRLFLPAPAIVDLPPRGDAIIPELNIGVLIRKKMQHYYGRTCKARAHAAPPISLKVTTIYRRASTKTIDVIGMTRLTAKERPSILTRATRWCQNGARASTPRKARSTRRAA